MPEVEKLLDVWRANLCQTIDFASVFSKNPVAYKWKAPHRSRQIRESTFWRTHDLLVQAHSLFTQNHVLGSRILLRSALETLATLIYLNQMTTNKLDFHVFSDKTSQLLLGSRNKTTKHESISIITILGKCDKKYSGISGVYADLCESAHPNFEGTSFGYSRIDYETHETNFRNYWYEMWGDRHILLVRMIAGVFTTEYKDVWIQQIRQLESWIVEHDAALERTKCANI